MDVYTDGGCIGNPGKGGWASIIVLPDKEITLKDAHTMTTNNRMELLAVIKSLEFIHDNSEWLNKKDKIKIFTDSKYVQQGITDWIKRWKINGWKTSTKKPVKNKDLWLILSKFTESIEPDWEWVQGHSGNIYNERCDELVHKAIEGLES